MRGPCLFTQRNLARVLRAVKAAGVDADVVVGETGEFRVALGAAASKGLGKLAPKVRP